MGKTIVRGDYKENGPLVKHMLPIGSASHTQTLLIGMPGQLCHFMIEEDNVTSATILTKWLTTIPAESRWGQLTFTRLKSSEVEKICEMMNNRRPSLECRVR